jgi:hypothetical protein
VTDYGGSRQIRQQEFVPTEARDLVSSEQHQYADGISPMQVKYAQNATYNGSDALRRLRGSEGG